MGLRKEIIASNSKDALLQGAHNISQIYIGSFRSWTSWRRTMTEKPSLSGLSLGHDHWHKDDSVRVQQMKHIQKGRGCTIHLGK
jgi:hypothetical protein